jgi:hypothetical protein
MDKSFLSLMLFVLFTTKLIAAEVINDKTLIEDHFGNCSILPPNTSDNNRHYCPETNYGIVYNNFLIANTCYSTIFSAIDAMKSSSACLRSTQLGHCDILPPNRLDNNRRYCPDTNYGVTYNNFLMSNSSCYESLEKAMNAMESSTACLREDRLGDLNILYPNRLDNNRRYCQGVSFGLLYKGTLAENICYMSIDAAIEELYLRGN